MKKSSSFKKMKKTETSSAHQRVLLVVEKRDQGSIQRGGVHVPHLLGQLSRRLDFLLVKALCHLLGDLV